MAREDDPREIEGEQAALSEKAHRRRFTAAYKAAILESLGECRNASERAALLSREGLYRSHIYKWQEQSDAARLAGLAPRKRGRKPKVRHPLEREVGRLELEKERLRQQLRQAELVVEVQKTLLRSPETAARGSWCLELLMGAIERRGSELGVARLCSALGVPRATYYRRQRRRAASNSSGSEPDGPRP